MKAIASLLILSLTIVVDADLPDYPTSCTGKCSYKETPGSLPIDVSADGQGGMTAIIGIQVPRGTGGREPGFTLKYSNNAGNGRIGLGWQLVVPSINSTLSKTAHGERRVGGSEFHRRRRLLRERHSIGSRRRHG